MRAMLRTIFFSRWTRAFAFLLFVVLAFQVFYLYGYTIDNAGLKDIFTYTDFRDTDAFRDQMRAAGDEVISMVRKTYSGTVLTEKDFYGSPLEDCFHYYFYADDTRFCDIEELEDFDFLFAKTMAMSQFDAAYVLDSSSLQSDYFSMKDWNGWGRRDLTGYNCIPVFSCDAGAILVPDADWLDHQLTVWSIAKNRAMTLIILACAAVLPLLYLFLFPVHADPEFPERRSRIFSEVLVLLAVLFVALFVRASDKQFLGSFHDSLLLFGFGEERTVYSAVSVMFTALAVCVVLCLENLLRRLREHRFYGDSFLKWFLTRPLWRIRSYLNRKFFVKYRFSAAYLFRLVLFVLAEALLITFWVIARQNRYWIVLRVILFAAVLFVLFLFFLFAYRDMRSVNRLLDHITALRDGTEPDASIRARAERDDPGSPLARYEADLQSVEADFDRTMKSQLAAERSKVDLITNVSHDLRTPLTSIIGYLDLLSKQDLSDDVREYVDLISLKSNRLKELVSDVFALSKASSGAEEVPMEDLDLFVLAQQTVADLSDSSDCDEKRIRISGEGTAPIRSNGNKIYRILQNLLDNALKYSLDGTRVYVSLTSGGGWASVAVKNTSSYEMEFTADQITEQFVRGNPARTGEGSGLGLAIARSFTEQLGGTFRITIDGDQFIARVSFPLRDSAGEPAQEESK